MDQEKFGKFIKDIRKQNNLTQQQLASKYNVTYQAVSKWETGKNMPDISLIKQISIDFNIDINDILNGKISKKQSKKKILITSFVVIILLFITVLILYLNSDKSFEFKTITTTCNSFNISGSIAYNSTKSSIYISNINYCGGSDNTDYKSIECILYENNGNVDIKIDTYNYNEKELIKLEDYLKNLKFNVDNYSSTCKQYKDNSLYLQINAIDENNKTTSYKIPLSLEDNCIK